MFKKILIANRGEIACRIARSCRRLGVAVAGVHSAADANALHVKTIGESIEIGAAPASESYLRINTVIAAARTTGAEAIHPGFGFLAENTAFAQAVEGAGLVFIGPTPDNIKRLGDKASAKREAIAAGLPTVPGCQAPSEDLTEIEDAVRQLGLPVMLKAAAGGGGKGMRVISSIDSLREEIGSAMREAENAFGNAYLIVEKLIQGGRHIEVQIVGDGNGNVIHLFERECSLQRRHQKLIEEAPAPNLASRLRDRMLEDAVQLGRGLKYRSVGTVEFLVIGAEYYFLEVNPRIQVEHTVTEMVTGKDIVELMLHIAAGDDLSIAQRTVTCRGHAIEARICAEDPNHGFMPCTGELAHVSFPAGDIRVESGVESGSIVTPYYDSMLAKLIAHADTRDEALDRLGRALNETSIFGVTTNREFLERLIALPETRNATFHTRLLDDQIYGSNGVHDSHTDTLAMAGYFWMMLQRETESKGPWLSRELTGWHMASDDDGMAPIPILYLESAGKRAAIRFAPMQADNWMLIGVNEAKVAVKLSALGDHKFVAAINSRRDIVRIFPRESAIYVHDARRAHALYIVPHLRCHQRALEASGELRAPMTGVVLKVNVDVGARVKAGDAAIIMESMKMELRIVSEVDGTATAVHVKPGDAVHRNAIVVVIERDTVLAV
ncbi:biotin carboxylase N-terminal domain-containing protein [Bradyrhizobium sp. CCGUVB14]|uniref:acetyl/propionyl/methylcrotonyl-CoA carboxylase subunit alpha n=1 Tax=Bradyrhizobium sp. CCGUVB14 TaxID=2949628 RepID=UPI0020B384AA|nr:biotin carboxylase N-terminal domain-containing protein [Bradyrhizobium sp. CCGUVB14]MCP3441120.1 ATP-grasp domain-containing protein [Bradyrhizobium sp. CCGUVB14]